MATVTSKQWVESEDWRSIVSPEHHEDFLRTLKEMRADGSEVTSVLVIGGTPITYNTRG